MLLFQKRFHAGLVSGEITLTFRRWARTHVRAGGRYRCHPIGVLEVTEVREVRVEEITEADAINTGFATLAELLEYMASASDAPLLASSTVFRVQLRHGGDGDRVELALEDQLSAEDVEAIAAKLAKLDAKRAWTQKTLAIIAERPRVAASQLAAALKRKDKLEFKEDVRKLKKLGLTQSFEVGYEVSPRGRAYMAARAATAARKPSRAAPAKKPRSTRKSASSR
ncbi:MAG TPA: ASCH domain-containing protein [Polyangiales bacterium]|nr:ASCH domain-containing protein [Polyangiales bacterium]